MNKKLVIIVGLLFIIIPTAISATYKIKNGMIINPSGQIINKENNNSNYNSEEEPLFSQQQTAQHSDNVADVEIEHPYDNLAIKTYLSKNEDILKSEKPTVNISNIISKYARDPNATANKIAIQQNKNPFGCTITTFSNSSEYSVKCDFSKYAYYYKSVDDPQLVRFDYYTKIKSNEVALCYFKEGNSNDLNSWKFKQIIIYYLLNDFIYEKTNNKYKLIMYYSGDTAYNPVGSYNHTRQTKSFF